MESANSSSLMEGFDSFSVSNGAVREGLTSAAFLKIGLQVARVQNIPKGFGAKPKSYLTIYEYNFKN